MPLEDLLHQLTRIMRHIPATAYAKQGIQEPFRMNKGIGVLRHMLGLQVGNIVFCIIEKRLQVFEDRFIGTEKVNKGNG